MNILTYFFSILIPLTLLDYLWLGHIMRNWYAAQFGSHMRPDIQFTYAGLLYIFYSIGIIYFCILPHIHENDITHVTTSAFIFGIICYMTYDLTNAATLANFPVSIIIPDILWGGIVTALSASIGFYFGKLW